MVRWQKALAVTGWLVLGAIFGPPVFGAASTLLWNEAADGQTAVKVAWRMYERLYPPTVGLAFIGDNERLPDVSLGISCNQHYREGIESGDDATFELEGAIRQHSTRQLHALLKSGPAYDALLSLPRPVLGALDACIGGSPLIWPFCQAYARRVADKAQAERAKSSDEIVHRVRRETEAIWCAAAKSGTANGR